MKKITRSILFAALTLSGLAQAQELLPDWDANGQTGAGTEANKWGWAATFSETSWGVANGSSTRYVDGATLPIDGTSASLSSRLLYIRWDAGENQESATGYYSLGLPEQPGTGTETKGVPLEAGKTYTASGHIAWWANAAAPRYAIGISTAKDGSVAPIAVDTVTITQAQVYMPFSIEFTPPTSDDYYLLIDQAAGFSSGGAGGLAAITDISLTMNENMGLQAAEAEFAKVFPNPAQNILNIQSEKNISDYKIYDIQGRMVAAQELSTSDRSIDISGLSKGSYLLEVSSEDKVQVIKFLK